MNYFKELGKAREIICKVSNELRLQRDTAETRHCDPDYYLQEVDTISSVLRNLEGARDMVTEAMNEARLV